MSAILEDKFRDGSTGKTLPQQDIDAYEDRFAAAQHGLADFPYLQNHVDNPIMYHRQNCWRNAAFIYLNTAIRGSPNKGLLSSATSRLIESLQKSDLWAGWAPHANVLLWVLFIALSGALGYAEKSLFALQFQRLMRDMGLLSFEQIREVLQQELWRDSVLDQPLRNAWINAALEK
jgi:hypothetical protein